MRSRCSLYFLRSIHSRICISFTNFIILAKNFSPVIKWIITFASSTIIKCINFVVLLVKIHPNYIIVLIIQILFDLVLFILFERLFEAYIVFAFHESDQLCFFLFIVLLSRLELLQWNLFFVLGAWDGSWMEVLLLFGGVNTIRNCWLFNVMHLGCRIVPA